MLILIGTIAAAVGIFVLVVGTLAGNTANSESDSRGRRRATVTRFLGMLLVLVGGAILWFEIVWPWLVSLMQGSAQG